MSSWLPTKDKPLLGNFILQQCHLLQNSFRVTLIQLVDDKNQIILHKQLPHVDIKYVYYKRFGISFLNMLSKRVALKKALKNLKDVDVIHGHVSFPDGWQFDLAKRLLGVPLVLTEHGSYYRKGGITGLKMKAIIERTIQAANRVVAVSQFQADAIQAYFPNVHCQIIGNPVNVDLFKTSRNEKGIRNFLHVSTLASVKNVNPIIEAFSMLSVKWSDVKLTIVSDEDKTEVKKKVERLGIVDQVVFAGPLNHQDLVYYYKNADCLVMNSHFESFSIVVVEAWASGIPVISTNVGVASDLPKQLGEQTNGEVTSILKAMTRMVEGSTLFNEQDLLAKAQLYSNTNVLGQLTTMYDEL